MKRKPLSHYLDLMKSVQDKQAWVKAKRYGEIALKKLNKLSYSQLEEYLLYCRIGYAYNGLAEYSRSLDAYYKANLIASKNRLNPAYITYASSMIGHCLLQRRNIDQALFHFQKAEEYYHKYGDGIFPMDKQNYFNTFIYLGHCYLYKNKLEQAQKNIEIIEAKLSFSPSPRPNELILCNYHDLKGKYLMIRKEYDQARQSFQEAIKIYERLNYSKSILKEKIHLAEIELLDSRLESATQLLKSSLKEARRLKFNELICIFGLLLSKCYTLKNMPDKASSIEKRIKPILNKLDIVWLYENTRQFERLYLQMQPIYQTETKSIPTILTHTLDQHYKTLSYNEDIVIGQSAPIREVYHTIEKIAPTDLPVLIQGETGTGKELVARAIHQNSLRKDKTWLALNCSAVSETLLENELFGHTKGAFTDAREDKKGYIEIASEGTFFLDEIADMSPAMQQKLLRVLEEKLIWQLGAQKPIPVNPRFIFATNLDIEQLIKRKRFRLDLFHRINTINLILPPLRERKEDIPLLVQHFLKKYAPNKMNNVEMPSDILGFLMNYPWPGNIRELENEIKRIGTLYPDAKQITPSMLSDTIRNYTGFISADGKGKFNLKNMKEMMEKQLIIEGLKKYNGNISRVARQLGCSRLHLYRKINRLNIHLK